MKSQKKVILSALLTMAILTCGTLTAVAASAESPNIETAQETESCIILGKDAEKEPDGIAKVSFDLGKTWLSESEALYSEVVEVEYWTFNEYQSYAKTVEQDLTEMLANNEPDLSEEDIQKVYEAFCVIASKKEKVSERELDALLTALSELGS